MPYPIGKYDERITFQQYTIGRDAYGNRVGTWQDYFSCSAHVKTYERGETGEVVVRYNDSVTFVVRYCPELKAVDSTGWRVIYDGVAYDVKGVDKSNYDRRNLAFKAEHVEGRKDG